MLEKTLKKLMEIMLKCSCFTIKMKNMIDMYARLANAIPIYHIFSVKSV